MKTHFYTNDIIKICDNNHLTVDEIYEKIATIYPQVWKSSIYRNVEELVKLWELKKVVWAWKKSLFEKNKWEHIHIIDEKSWEVIDIDIDNITIPWLPKNFKISNLDIKVFWNYV